MPDESDANRSDLRSGSLQAFVLTLRFLSELALLATLAVVGANASGPIGVRIALAIGGAIVAAVIWGLVIARQARRRLPDPWRLAAEMVLFAIAGVGLLLEGAVIAAAIFFVLSAGIALIARFVAPEG